jgi:hypothetical protein
MEKPAAQVLEKHKEKPMLLQHGLSLVLANQRRRLLDTLGA